MPLERLRAEVPVRQLEQDLDVGVDLDVPMLRCNCAWTLNVFSASSFLSPMALRAAARISVALSLLRARWRPLREQREHGRQRAATDLESLRLDEVVMIAAMTFRPVVP